MSGSRGSGFDTYTYRFSFFFNLVEKNSFTVKKISKCRENGIDRLRNGNLRRRSTFQDTLFVRFDTVYNGQ